MKFKHIEDSDHQSVWQSTKFNNGDFDYWLILRLLYLEEYGQEFSEKYEMSVHIAAPSELNDESLGSLLETFGFDENYEQEVRNNPELLAQLVVEYGTSVTAWSEMGSNKAELLKHARKEAELVNSLFGFYMDRTVNMIGTTGWELVSGDLLAGMTRWK